MLNLASGNFFGASAAYYYSNWGGFVEKLEIEILEHLQVSIKMKTESILGNIKLATPSW